MEELDIVAILKGYRHPYFLESVTHAMDMGVHINGDKPIKLLERVRPREDPEVKRYRLESYEPITTSTADKAMVTTQKIMNPKLYTIKFPDSAKDVEQYLFKNYPFYGNILTYVNDAIIRCMISDPNGLLCVVPLDMNITDAEKVQPVVTIFKSRDIWDYEFGKWYLIHEKQLKNKDGTTDWFYYIDTTKVTYFKVVTNLDKYTQTILSEYIHNIGRVPAWQLSGIIKDVNREGVLFRSFFSAAVPYWNKAVTGDSDLDGAFVNHMHPIRVELTEDCDFNFQGMRCNGGKVMNTEGREYTCPGCSGTGRRSVKSPYGVYQVQKSPLGEQASSIQPVSYVSVPTEPTVLLSERVQKHLNKGLEALNMFFEIGENQSGIAKVLDRSELYDFLLTVSTTVFDTHITNIIYFTEAYVYMGKVVDKLPVIQKPVSFDLLSVQEEALAVQAAQTAGLDPMYLKFKQLNFMQKDLFGKQGELNVATDALLLNPFSFMTPDEVTNAFNIGAIDESDMIVYFNIERFIQQAYADNPKFYELTYDQKVETLNGYAEEMESGSANVMYGRYIETPTGV